MDKRKNILKQALSKGIGWLAILPGARYGMGRFSRVKGGCGKKCEAPDLEAHFSDGAWYDIVLRAADPTRNRFLVQVRAPHSQAHDADRDADGN